MRSFRFLSLSLSVALSVSVAACGGQTLSSTYTMSDAPASAAALATPPISVSADVHSACAAQSQALCELRDSCTDGYANNLSYGGLDACVALRTAACEANTKSPNAAETVADINACAMAYPSESCTAWWDGDTVPACRSAVGTRQNGDACGVNSQCSSGFCQIAENAQCGSCASTPHPGDPCQTSANCGYALACPIVAPATSSVCTMRAELGQPCDGYTPCQGGLACVGSHTSEGVLGTCVIGQTTVGAPCNTGSGPGCDGEQYLFCSFGTCQKQSVVASGQSCGSISDVADVKCAAGASCVIPSGGTIGTCVAAVADGEDCDLLSGPPCLSPSKCISSTGPEGTSGTCVFPDPASCG